MIKRNLLIGVIAAALFVSCNDSQKRENADATDLDRPLSNEVVTESLTNEDGKTLKMSFDNSQGTATLNYQGEEIVLDQERSASGIWYKNKEYELRGKGNDITLKKDGEVIFEHQDDKVEVEAKNSQGDVLTMNFNNTAGTVQVYLNGGNQINLEQEKAASGIWYKNEEYELRGKGDHYTLTKDGETIFEN